MKKLLLFSIALFCFVAAFAQAPTITSFSPASGPVGTTVTITGSNFSTSATSNIVYFGATKASVISSTATTIIVTVPAQSTFEPISVTTNKRIAYSKKPFLVTFIDGNSALSTTSFAPRIDLAMNNNLCYYTREVALADFDNDGKADIAVNDANTKSIYIIKNNGSSAPALFNSTPTVTLNTGTNSVYLVVSDFNADGLKDVAVLNQGSNTVDIFLNTTSGGTISFAPKIELTTANAPRFMTIGDVDSDGLPDIAVSCSNGVSVYRNISDNTGVKFAPRTDYLSTSPGGLSISDLNNDGKPELIIAYPAGESVAIMGNTSVPGSVSFSAPVNVATTDIGPNAVTVFDADGDGKPDICIAYYDGLTLLPNTSSDGGSFSFGAEVREEMDISDPDIAGQIIPTGDSNRPFTLTIGDADGDGKPDIAVSYGVGGPFTSFSVVKNISTVGNIKLGKNVEFDTYTPESLAIGDIDGDGKPDIVVGSREASVIYIVKNTTTEPTLTGYKTANGTNVTITGTNLTKTSTVTINGVPVSSFIKTSETVITATVAANTTGTISVTTPYGTATLHGFTNVPPPVITSFSPAFGVVGSKVVISGSNFNTAAVANQVFFGQVKAVVTAATKNSLTVTVPYGSMYQPIRVVNNNLTGYSALPFVTTFPGGPQKFTPGSFAPKTDVKTAYAHPKGITAADFDGDGNLDVAFADNYDRPLSSVYIFKNSGNAQTPFSTAPVIANVNGNPLAVVTGDFDGDGKPDLAVANDQNSTFSILKNTSSGGTISFAPKIDFSAYYNPDYLFVADLDGDGKPDIVSVSPTTEFDYFSVYRNTTDNGVISFSHKADYVCNGFWTEDILIADIDGDGKPDIVVVTNNNSFDIFRNTSVNGSISFANQVTIPTFFGNGVMAVGDFNNDGKPDLAMLTATNQVSIYRNTSTIGNVSFATAVNSLLPTTAYSNYLAINDLDGDGKPDIIVSNASTSGSTVSVLKNLSTSTTLAFDSGVDFATGLTPEMTATGDFNHDSKPDMAVAAYGNSGFSLLLNQVNAASLTSYTLTPGATSNTVNIVGANLLGATALTFGGVAPVSFTVVSASLITAVISKTASGTITVVTPAGTASLTGFVNIPTPVISSYTITKTSTTPIIVITGSFFTGTTAVTVAGNVAYFTVNSDTQITATMSTSTLGDVSVTTPGGIAIKAYVPSSSMTTLSALTISTATLNPTFVSTIYSYTVSAGNATSSINVTPTVTDPSATVKVNGATVSSGAASSPIALNVGSNTIAVLVTAQDGVTTQTYTITVTRAASSVATLSGLTISAGTLTPAFSSSTYNYTASVGNSTSSITVTPTATDATESINIRGSIIPSGSSTAPIVLKVDTNIIAAVIMAQDGKTYLNYYVNVTRSAPPVAVITSVSPLTAAAGSTVTITGSNFTGATAVSFGGVAATSFTVGSSNAITAVVGAGATGNITVTTPVNTANIAGFNFVPVPTITAAGPTTVISGGSVVLNASPVNGFSYQWLRNGVNIIGATSSSYTATVSGVYTVSISLNSVSQVSAGITVTTVFELPANNFHFIITGATCKGSANGAISITATQSLNYTATITGNGVNTPYAFTSSTQINNLAAGTYDVCITVTGQPNFQQCFTTVISEPKDLSVYTAVSPSGDQVVVNMDGGSEYKIKLNGILYVTEDSQITLPLLKGVNTITVTTDLACQGAVVKSVNLSPEVLVYPNPFSNILNLSLGSDNLKTALISVISVGDGKPVYTNIYNNVTGTLQIDLSGLNSGLYLLRVSGDNLEKVFKIIKK